MSECGAAFVMHTTIDQISMMKWHKNTHKSKLTSCEKTRFTCVFTLDFAENQFNAVKMPIKRFSSNKSTQFTRTLNRFKWITAVFFVQYLYIETRCTWAIINRFWHSFWPKKVLSILFQSTKKFLIRDFVLHLSWRSKELFIQFNARSCDWNMNLN